MCTLTLHQVGNALIFTSNRDDQVGRNSLKYAQVQQGDFELFYPQDALQKGTWLALTSQGDVAILLNGCEVKHQKEAHHVQSRGRIPIEFLKSKLSLFDFQRRFDFHSFEPFTLIAYVNNELEELKGDGQLARVRKLPVDKKAYIWSSVTLYDEPTRKQREETFYQFLAQNLPAAEPIFQLFLKTFLLNREPIITLSTSQIVLDPAFILFKSYHHIEQQEISKLFLRDETSES